MKHKKKLVLVGLALLSVVMTVLPLMGCKNDSVPATLDNTLTIAFNSKGGSEVKKQTVEVGNKATEPTAPKKEGAVFGGWYLENTTKKYDFSTPVLESMVLYAKWIEEVNAKNVEVSPQNVKGIFEGVAKGETVALKATGMWTASDMNSLRIVLLENKEIKIRLDLSASGLKEIPSDMLNGCSNLESIDLPASLTSIGEYAFSGCDSLASINLSSISLTDIGSWAFYSCDNLKSINLPASLTSIGDYTFSGCTNLASINLPEGLTDIGEYAFRSCRSLESIDLPARLTSIGMYAFYSCNKLVTITVRATTPPGLGSNAFYGCTSLTKILVPSDYVTIYQTNWSGYREKIQAIQ